MAAQPPGANLGRFTRNSRLLTGSDFDRVFQRSRSSADAMFTVLYRVNGLGYPRLGLALARKRVRRAVDRNRLKRLVRESFRRAQQTLGGIDIVVMARARAGVAPNAAVLDSLGQHWRKLSERAADSSEPPARH